MPFFPRMFPWWMTETGMETRELLTEIATHLPQLLRIHRTYWRSKRLSMANEEKADSIDFPTRRTFTVDEQTPNERELAAIVLVARCCEKDCLLHLTAHDVIMTI